MPIAAHTRSRRPVASPVISFDARSLGPKTRHWGVGVVIDNIVSRLSSRFSFAGIAPRFNGAAEQGLRTWPNVGKAGVFLFEFSPLLAGHSDVYWATNHFLPALCRQPSVVTVHDLLLLKYPGEQSHTWFLARRLVSSVKRAHRILTDSRTTADDLIAVIPELRRKVEVGVLGFERADDDVDAGTQPAREPYVVMLGAHARRKNLPLALAAIERLAERGVQVPLLLTGDVHRCFSDLVRRNQHLIQPLGVLPKAEMFRLLRGARALLFPSLYEGFGFPMLEAMAARCPVLALDTAINREIGGEGLWRLPPDPEAWAQALQELLKSASLADELAAKGTENLERFSWERTADIYASAFTEVAG